MHIFRSVYSEADSRADRKFIGDETGVRANRASLPRNSDVKQLAKMSGTYVHTIQARDVVSAYPSELFEYLDNAEYLGFLVPMAPSIPHCAAASCVLVEQQGEGVGARVRREGKFFGSRLAVNEEVEVYAPPRRKVWRTVDKPRLFVIESYRMGFEVEPLPVGADVCAFIDWNPLHSPFHRLLDWVGERCARRFANSILNSAKRHFEPSFSTTYRFRHG